MQRTTSCFFLRRTLQRNKKSGKPMDVFEHKQVYLPYEASQAPTPAELERERRRFATARTTRVPHKTVAEVRDIPVNMYTYGKEGSSLPIAIFKDQPDPVIGPEWTYPGIYENKIACRPWTMHQLFEFQRTNTWPSYLMPQMLQGRVQRRVAGISSRMGLLRMSEMARVAKERGATPGKKAGGAVTKKGVEGSDSPGSVKAKPAPKDVKTTPGSMPLKPTPKTKKS